MNIKPYNNIVKELSTGLTNAACHLCKERLCCCGVYIMNRTKMARPPKPKNREAVMQSFRRDELPQGAGLDPKTNMVAVWFHGIISRERAEELLQRRAPGAFWSAWAERILGYGGCRWSVSHILMVMLVYILILHIDIFTSYYILI